MQWPCSILGLRRAVPLLAEVGRPVQVPFLPFGISPLCAITRRSILPLSLFARSTRSDASHQRESSMRAAHSRTLGGISRCLQEPVHVSAREACLLRLYSFGTVGPGIWVSGGDDIAFCRLPPSSNGRGGCDEVDSCNDDGFGTVGGDNGNESGVRANGSWQRFSRLQGELSRDGRGAGWQFRHGVV